MNENHPVLLSLDAELDHLRSAYIQQPNEQTRYQLVRLEQLIQQWAPGRSSNGRNSSGITPRAVARIGCGESVMAGALHLNDAIPARATAFPPTPPG